MLEVEYGKVKGSTLSVFKMTGAFKINAVRIPATTWEMISCTGNITPALFFAQVLRWLYRFYSEKFSKKPSIRIEIATVTKRDQSQQALRQVEKITDSKRVRGETLLRSDENSGAQSGNRLAGLRQPYRKPH